MKTVPFALLLMLSLTGCGPTDMYTDEEGTFEELDDVEQNILACNVEGAILWVKVKQCCLSSDPNAKRMQKKRKFVCRDGVFRGTTRTRCIDACTYY